MSNSYGGILSTFVMETLMQCYLRSLISLALQMFNFLIWKTFRTEIFYQGIVFMF